MATKARGTLICMEGIDHSGKTTQAELLVKSLNEKGLKTGLIKFPDRSTPIGKLIDSHLKGIIKLEPHAASLLFSANKWEKAQEIHSKLLSGENIVLDRYIYSGIAYSVAKGLNKSWCANLDRDLPEPDITFYLDLSPSASMERFANGEKREFYEEEAFQTSVSQIFSRLLGDLTTGRTTCTWGHVIDANESIDTIHEKIAHFALNYIWIRKVGIEEAFSWE